MAFTGRQRERRTRPFVKWLDRSAEALITIGGLGTIAAVLAVCLFLVGVVLPLFQKAQAEPFEARLPSVASSGTELLRVQPDEYLAMAWTLDREGLVRAFRLEDGTLLEERSLIPEGAKATAISAPAAGELLAVGLDDGRVVLARLGFRSSFFELDAAPPGLRDLPSGVVALHENGVAQRTPEGQVRLQTLEVEIEEPVSTSFEAAVRLVDAVESSSGPIFVALAEDGALRLNRVRKRRNLLTGRVSLSTQAHDLPGVAPRGEAPSHLHLTGLGDALLLGWPDGRLARYDLRDPRDARRVEELDLLEDPEATVSAAGMLLGRSTLLVGSSTGELSAWFRTKPADAGTSDGALLTRAHRLPPSGGAVVSLGTSERSRIVAVGDATGVVRLIQVTTEQELLRLDTGSGRALATVAIAPKEDAVVAAGTAGLAAWAIDLGHPEASFASLFRPVWYEGADEPQQVWQSSSGTDDFEMKLGLLPLIFGTLKATVYSMLFGGPLALLAAIYTSEFLRNPLKSRVKSSIELMASLPSVVLGFLAALVIAPWVEGRVPAVLAAFFTVPFVVLLGARAWQLLPPRWSLRLDRYRLLAILAVLPLGVLLATVLGPLLERLLFAGNLTLWLDGQTGSATGGWFLALLPLSVLALSLASGRWLSPVLRRLAREQGWSRGRFALVDLLRFLVAALASAALALLLGSTLSGFGLDARGLYLGTYVQRNALVVGFIMGFAIIPIIYTIAEDALGAVPDPLRSASLGAGATPWQTAIRVVVPTAMSGLFSALMIGLGRAVGETMIVLMAAGNTPVMDWNLFNGFRTLSANIAVELPEAVRGSTHYRTLFLAALTLFAMTFVVNTVAEIVRLRFRKRAYRA